MAADASGGAIVQWEFEDNLDWPVGDFRGNQRGNSPLRSDCSALFQLRGLMIMLVVQNKVRGQVKPQ